METENMSNEEQFHANRMTCIGGSDIPAICGLSEYSSALTVYNRLKGIGPPQVQNEAMFWGTKNEPIIAEVYTERTGRELMTADFKRHPDYDWIGGHVDRLVVSQPGIVECKTASEYVAKLFGEPGSDEIPNAYIMQGQWYMEIFDRDWCDYPVKIGGNRMHIYRAVRNPEIFNLALEKAKTFWFENVQKSIPPDPDDSQACSEALKALYPQDKGLEIVSTSPAVGAAVISYMDMRAEKKLITNIMMAAKNTIVAEMGEASVMTGPGFSVSYKKSADFKKLNSKQFVAENSELAARYMDIQSGPRKLVTKVVPIV